MAISPTADRTNIGHQVSTADTDETLLSAPDKGRLGLAGISATIASGLTTQTVVVKDGTNVLTRLDVPAGGHDELTAPNLLPLDGDLVVQATSTDVEITAWAADTT